MKLLLVAARRLLLVPLVAAAYGWQDVLRGLPGPRVALVLPLREPSHQAGVPLLGLLAVWLLAFAIAARVVPVRVLGRAPAALVRGGITFAVLVVVQAVSLELVREATLGLDWGAALVSAAPAIAGACAVAGTFLATPARRPPLAAAAAIPRKSDRLRRATLLLPVARPRRTL